MDFNQYEAMMAEAKKQRASKKKKKKKKGDLQGDSSQMEDAAAADNEPPLTQVIPPAAMSSRGPIFHDPTLSGPALRRAVHLENLMELATMSLGMEEKVAEMYRVSTESREKYVATQNELYEARANAAHREKALQ
ncbi:uncharacterized protein LOC131157752 [Malania oleifera]|uniref:uncharacterized protein LOC131157752 n=1 Tax=Malania oleifera TaxID=397392 RepID=UPI0025AEAF26|nr:uncharacterized protein LOC131157752 [Malania oleifera]